jgi:DNA-binding transcriptional MerR regulator
MAIAERRNGAVTPTVRRNVIANSILLSRRIRELQRRRQTLVAQQEHLRTQLPDWAVEPLRLVGMTKEEIRTLVNDWSTAETEAGLDRIERDLDEVDRQIEDLETMLVTTPSSSLEEIEAVVGLAVARFHEIIVTDPEDVFYDHGEARLIALIERVHEDLCTLLGHERLEVG